MNATVPFSTRHPWVLAETSQSALEVLGVVAAVIGALLWVVGLVWLILADVFRAAHRSRKHDGAGTSRGTDHRSQ